MENTVRGRLEPTPKIIINRSKRRRKTVSAKIVNEAMIVSAPIRMSERELQKVIEGFKKRFEQRAIKKDLQAREDLSIVAQRLNEKYFKGNLQLNSIKYVTNQTSKYGCCDYNKKSIRISHRLAKMPIWVRDYVIIHELAHLVEPNHSKAFWLLVSRYKHMERAKGFLLAKGLDESEASW